MFSRGLLTLLAIVILGPALPARTFTNTEGRTIEATIVGATAETVTLRLANRRTTTIPLSTLSEADRTHIAGWLANRIPSLRFTPNVTRSNKKSSPGSSRQEQAYEMNVDVRNEENTKGLEASTMKWIIVGRSLSEQDQYKILAAQEAEFTVPVSGRANIPFRKVISTYYDSKFSDYKSGFKCIGYVLYAARKSDQREVYSHASTNLLKEHLEAIIQLETGDVTNEFFSKPAQPGSRTEDPDAPLIVR